MEELRTSAEAQVQFLWRNSRQLFSIVVCELNLKCGNNYIEAFAFKQLAHYVHYEALDVYE
jgi:hypothetical protein